MTSQSWSPPKDSNLQHSLLERDASTNWARRGKRRDSECVWGAVAAAPIVTPHLCVSVAEHSPHHPWKEVLRSPSRIRTSRLLIQNQACYQLHQRRKTVCGCQVVPCGAVHDPRGGVARSVRDSNPLRQVDNLVTYPWSNRACETVPALRHRLAEMERIELPLPVLETGALPLSYIPITAPAP